MTTAPIELRSDNAAGVAPEIMEAVLAADRGSALAYGVDAWTERMTDTVSAVFERRCDVFPVVSGTAANALALSAMSPPWGSVLCHHTAHILNSECGSTSMFGGGTVMRGVGGLGSLMTPEGLAEAFETTRWGDNHHSQPRVLSFTSPTDRGEVYPVATVAELAATAHQQGLRVHLDGARIANAIVALGCTPAELTWKAGIDVFSLGATKNGALSTDAIVSFDPDVSAELIYRTKRSGHVASKMRFQSAQIDAYLTDGLWLRLAGRANGAMARLAEGLKQLAVELEAMPAANMVFLRADDALADRLESSGLLFYRTGRDEIRFVTSFQTTDAVVDAALDRFSRMLSIG